LVIGMLLWPRGLLTNAQPHRARREGAPRCCDRDRGRGAPDPAPRSL